MAQIKNIRQNLKWFSTNIFDYTKILVVWVGKWNYNLKGLLIKFIIPNSNSTYIFDYTKIWVVCVGNYNVSAYLLNSSYQIWVKFIFVYQKPLKQFVQTGFWVQKTPFEPVFLSCEFTKVILYSNVSIIAFWYTKWFVS